MVQYSAYHATRDPHTSPISLSMEICDYAEYLIIRADAILWHVSPLASHVALHVAGERLDGMRGKSTRAHH